MAGIIEPLLDVRAMSHSLWWCHPRPKPLSQHDLRVPHWMVTLDIGNYQLEPRRSLPQVTPPLRGVPPPQMAHPPRAPPP